MQTCADGEKWWLSLAETLTSLASLLKATTASPWLEAIPSKGGAPLNVKTILPNIRVRPATLRRAMFKRWMHLRMLVQVCTLRILLLTGVPFKVGGRRVSRMP
jgi:hypothetical protein